MTRCLSRGVARSTRVARAGVRRLRIIIRKEILSLRFGSDTQGAMDESPGLHFKTQEPE